MNDGGYPEDADGMQSGVQDQGDDDVVIIGKVTLYCY